MRTWTIQTGTEPEHPMETDPRQPVLTRVVELAPVLDLLERALPKMRPVRSVNDSERAEMADFLTAHGRLSGEREGRDG